MILLQVDVTLGMGTDHVLMYEDEASKELRFKPRTSLGEEPTTFNGISILKKSDGFTMSQVDKIENSCMPKTNEEYVSQHALAQYIGVNVRPYVCAPIQLLAPGNLPITEQQHKDLRKAFKYMIDTKLQGLRYVNLDLNSCKLVLLTDASFENTTDLKSQLGYLIVMVDKYNACNIFHYGYNKCKRV